MSTWIKSTILAVALTGLAGGAAPPAFAAPTFESITLGAASDLAIFSMGATTFSASNGGTAYQGNAGLASGAPTHLSRGDMLTGVLYTAPDPEPETHAMILAGLGMMGFVARRRKQVQDLA